MLSSLCFASQTKKPLNFDWEAFFDIGRFYIQQALTQVKYPLIDVAVFTNTPEVCEE